MAAGRWTIPRRPIEWKRHREIISSNELTEVKSERIYEIFSRFDERQIISEKAEKTLLKLILSILAGFFFGLLLLSCLLLIFSGGLPTWLNWPLFLFDWYSIAGIILWIIFSVILTIIIYKEFGKGIKGPKELITHSRRMVDTSFLSNGVVLDYSDSSLIKIDNSFSSDILKDFEKEGLERSQTFFLYFCLSIGCYLGEVILKNIGGRWITPKRNIYWPAIITGNIGLLFSEFSINLNGNRIPVLNIAKSRLDGSGRVKSLYEAYKKIESTGKWSESDYDKS